MGSRVNVSGAGRVCMNRTASDLLTQQRDLLAAIDGMLMLLAEGGLSEDQGGYLEVIWENLEKLKEIGNALASNSENLLSGSDTQQTPPLRAGTGRELFILVVDDDLVQQLFVTRVLEKRGHRVVTASDGRKGLLLAQNSNFDLILMDCQMPEVDGFQLTKAIRKLETSTGRRVPIAAFTSHAVAGYKQRCFEVGMDEFLNKPIPSTDLIEKVENICERHSAVPGRARW